ncbi:MAG: MarR family winged helix-turn-helix transcriptional regulator [Spirochaetota bacterium]
MNEYSRFGAAFALLNRAAHAYFSARLVPLGLSPPLQGYLLVVEPGEEVNQEEIARRHRVDKANAARAVGRLEALGLVARRQAPSDRRNRLVSLTPRGERVHAEVERMMQEWTAELRGAVSEPTWRSMLSGIEKMAGAAATFAAASTGAPEAIDLQPGAQERGRARSRRARQSRS